MSSKAPQVGTVVYYHAASTQDRVMCQFDRSPMPALIFYSRSDKVHVIVTDHNGEQYRRYNVTMLSAVSNHQAGDSFCTLIQDTPQLPTSQTALSKYQDEIAKAQEPLKPNAQGLYDGTCINGPYDGMQIANTKMAFIVFTNHSTSKYINPLIIVGEYKINRNNQWIWTAHKDITQLLQIIAEHTNLPNYGISGSGQLKAATNEAEQNKRAVTEKEIGRQRRETIIPASEYHDTVNSNKS